MKGSDKMSDWLADLMPLIIIALFFLVIFTALKSAGLLDILIRRYGHITMKEIHYNINQKIVKQIKTTCRQHRDREIKFIVYRTDPIVRPKKMIYKGHIILPDVVYFVWKRGILSTSKVGTCIHNQVCEIMGNELIIECNGLFNHDMLWYPVPTKRYLEKNQLTEKHIFDMLYDSFEVLTQKQEKFDLNNIGVENIIRGAKMSEMWKALIRQGDQLPQEAMPIARSPPKEAEE